MPHRCLAHFVSGGLRRELPALKVALLAKILNVWITDEATAPEIAEGS
jgi:DNA-binding transcriptional regulator LsrR (DeoR family)